MQWSNKMSSNPTTVHLELLQNCLNLGNEQVQVIHHTDFWMFNACSITGRLLSQFRNFTSMVALYDGFHILTSSIGLSCPKIIFKLTFLLPSFGIFCENYRLRNTRIEVLLVIKPSITFTKVQIRTTSTISSAFKLHLSSTF